MKNYICRDDLLKHILYGMLTRVYQEPEDVFTAVSTFPVVTKAEIYFERLKETCPHKHSDMCGDWFGGECCLNNCHLLKKAHISRNGE